MRGYKASTCDVDDLTNKFNKIKVNPENRIVKKRRVLPQTIKPSPTESMQLLVNDNNKIKKQVAIFKSIFEANWATSIDTEFINELIEIIVTNNNKIIENNNKLKSFMYCDSTIRYIDEKNDCYRLDNEILTDSILIWHD
jgi:hypothetical protein